MSLGTAVRQAPDGECEDRAYVGGVLEGQATVIYPDNSKEVRTYSVSLYFYTTYPRQFYCSYGVF